jgi:hypothetical protein
MYVVKHQENGKKNRDLINEVIGNRLAIAIGINTPEIAIIDIDSKLVPSEYKIERGIPKGVGFGSKWLKGTTVNLNEENSVAMYEKSDKETIARTFIMIILLDIWLRNTDRTIGNPNILIEETEKSINLVAIDHTMIFGGLGFDNINKEKDLEPTIEETLIQHKLFEKIKDDNGFLFDEMVKEIIQEIKNINEENVVEIFNLIPKEWEFTEEHKNCVKEFIMHRKEITEIHFIKLIN